MSHALIFTFAAPLAAFGAVAVGERRPTWDRPGKSQVIGLLASALGIRRIEEARLAELADNIKLAIRIDDAGQLATDYHTTQVPQQRRNRRFATRAEELAVPKHELKTGLSRREFRVGSRYTIAVWYEPARDDELAEIKTKLERPCFVPYAGRKAFPLMLPMCPQQVMLDDGIEAAFAAYDRMIPLGLIDLLTRRAKTDADPPPIFIDADAAKQQISRIEERRDVPESRSKWRFGVRAEAMLQPTARPAGGTP